MPGGEVRAADVADLAVPYEPVERHQRFLDWRLPIPLVHLEEVYVVDAQPAQTLLACRDQMVAGETRAVRSPAGLEARLCRHEDSVAPPFDHLADDFL